MQAARPSISTIHPVERFLAIAGAVACVIVTIAIWLTVSTQQTMWPLPGLYFSEMVALSIVTSIVLVRGNPHCKRITWGALGIFGAFSIVGAGTIGFFYIPVVLIYGTTAIVSDVRDKQHIAAHLGICLIAGIAQAVLMLSVIRLT